MNTVKKLLLVLMVFVLVPARGCAPKYDWNKYLGIPGINSVTGRSEALTIALWSAYDGRWVPEETILNSLAFYGDGTVDPQSMANAIGTYTNSSGYLGEFPNTEEGQDLAIAAVAESLHSNTPAIMPLGYLDYVIVSGGKGDYDSSGRPIAKRIRYISKTQYNYWMSVYMLKRTYYSPINSKFIVLLGDRKFVDDGAEKYRDFLDSGGTYYGGPQNYSPSQTAIKY